MDQQKNTPFYAGETTAPPVSYQDSNSPQIFFPEKTPDLGVPIQYPFQPFQPSPIGMIPGGYSAPMPNQSVVMVLQQQEIPSIPQEVPQELVIHHQNKNGWGLGCSVFFLLISSCVFFPLTIIVFMQFSFPILYFFLFALLVFAALLFVVFASLYRLFTVPCTYIFDSRMETLTVQYVQTCNPLRTEEVYNIKDVGMPWIDYVQVNREKEQFGTFVLCIPITSSRKRYLVVIGVLHRSDIVGSVLSAQHAEIVSNVRNIQRHLCEILRFTNQSLSPMRLEVKNYDLEAGHPLSYM